MNLVEISSFAKKIFLPVIVIFAITFLIFLIFLRLKSTGKETQEAIPRELIAKSQFIQTPFITAPVHIEVTRDLLRSEKKSPSVFFLSVIK